MPAADYLLRANQIRLLSQNTKTRYQELHTPNKSNQSNDPNTILRERKKKRKNTVITTSRKRSRNVSDLTRKTKSSHQGSSKTRRISIKESLDKALVQLGRDGDEENEYYSSSSGKLVVDCSKIKDLNNARWTMLC
jgi:50S ribosomal subunit-associated GTPase HflX